MKTIRHAFVGAAIVACTLAIGSAPAIAGSAVPAVSHQAAAPAADPVQTFQNQNTGRCIDDTNQGFRTFPCNGSPAQRWSVHVFNDGTRRLQSANTGRCMFDSDTGFHTVSPCDTSRNQSWFIDHPAPGQIAFRNQATQRCIDDTDQGGFRTFSCNSTRPQQWH
jgi:hypothetical protein